jgi:hypothetical protein
MSPPFAGNPFLAAPVAAAAAPPARRVRPALGWQLVLWFLLLPMFFQIFHYKQEAGPLYVLSKGWPLLCAPALLYGLLRLRLPDGVLYMAAIAYALVVTPFMGLMELPVGLVDAMLSTIKAWPFTYYFAAAALLVLLRPSEVALRRAAVGFGMATFAVMLLLWVTVPAERFQPVPFGANLFSWDEGRGNFIRMPMMLAELALFWMGRRLLREGRLWQLLLVVGAIVSMMTIYKARLPTGVSAVILLMNLALWLPVRWRWGLGALAMLPATAAALVLAPSIPTLLGEIFDESLFIRLRSVSAAWDWIIHDPLRLLLGSGSISTWSSITLADVLNSRDFWLTDIGWLGVLMEFGLAGTALIVLIHARALITIRALRHDDPFRAALGDYVLFEIMCSAVYSVMFAPGPVVTVAAIAWWLRARDQAGLRAEDAGWPPRDTAYARPTPPPVLRPAGG